jgi:hypothetical protein
MGQLITIGKRVLVFFFVAIVFGVVMKPINGGILARYGMDMDEKMETFVATLIALLVVIAYYMLYKPPPEEGA